jgi:D-alanyl-D-alanine carboxypeptidase
MADPPNPLGSATPRSQPIRNAVRQALGVRPQNPMVSVDPQTSSDLNRITSAVRSLKGEMKSLAEYAERYAAAMRGAGGARPGQMTKPGMGYAPGSPASRPSNMPPAAPGPGAETPAAAGSPAGQRSSPIERLAAGFEIMQRAVIPFMQGAMTRERTLNQIGIMNAGPAGSPTAFRPAGAFGGVGTANQYGQMLRGVQGYWSTGDLYAGAGTLEQIGALRGPNDRRSRELANQAGQLGQLTGTNFQGGANIMANIAAPQTIQGLQQFGVQVQPGGKMRDVAGIYGDLYNRITRGRSGAQATDLFRSGQQPGSALRNMLSQLGMSPETAQSFLMYGAMSAQQGGAMNQQQFQSSLNKNVNNASTNMQKFSQSMSQLKDEMATSVIPIFTALAKVLAPILGLVSKIVSRMDTLEKAFVGLATAVGVATLMEQRKAAGGVLPMLSNAVSKIPGAASLPGIGEESATAGIFGGLTTGASFLGAAGLGYLGGSLGSHIGRRVGGKGAKGKAGSIVGGAVLGGAAAGAGMGALAGLGVFDWATVPTGAALGGIVGGIKGAFGDPYPKGDAVPSDKDLLAHPPKPYNTPGGGPLAGPGNSAHLNPDFVKRLQKMFKDNPKLRLNSGWRSHDEQAYLRWQLLTGKRKAAVAPVGQSRHETGLAADLGPPSEYNWLTKNAQNYGVANVGAKFGEAWHYEPTGAVAPGGGGSATGAAPATAAASSPASSSGSTAVKGISVVAPIAGAPGTNEADWISSFLSAGGSGDPWPRTGIGDAAYTRMAGGGGTTTGQRGGITIQHAEFKVEIARGTPDELEKAARYLQDILTNRSNMEALARK